MKLDGIARGSTDRCICTRSGKRHPATYCSGVRIWHHLPSIMQCRLHLSKHASFSTLLFSWFLEWECAHGSYERY